MDKEFFINYINKINILIVGFQDIAYSICKQLMSFNEDVLNEVENSNIDIHNLFLKDKILFNLFVIDNENVEQNKDKKLKKADIDSSINNECKLFTYIDKIDYTNSETIGRLFDERDSAYSDCDNVAKLRKAGDFKTTVICVGDELGTKILVKNAFNSIPEIKRGRICIRLHDERYKKYIVGKDTNVECFNPEYDIAVNESIELMSDTFDQFIHITISKWNKQNDLSKQNHLKKEGLAKVTLTKTMTISEINKINGKTKNNRGLVNLIAFSNMKNISNTDNSLSEFWMNPIKQTASETIYKDSTLYVYGKLKNIYDFDKRLNKANYKKTFIIVGADRYGQILSENLAKIGLFKELIVLDKDRKLVDKISKIGISNARIANAEDIDDLLNVGIDYTDKDVDETVHAIICEDRDPNSRMRIALNLYSLNIPHIKIKALNMTEDEKNAFDDLKMKQIVVSDMSVPSVIPHFIVGNSLKYYSPLGNDNSLHWGEYGVAKLLINEDEVKNLPEYGLSVIDYEKKKRQTKKNKKARLLNVIVWGKFNKIIGATSHFSV